jgi:hypothetical protein
MKLLLPTSKKLTLKIAIMLRDALSPPLPDTPSDPHVEANAIDNAFDAMHLNQTTVSNANFSDNWGTADTEDAFTLSGVDGRRLNDCIVSTSASVWGVPTMCLVQLEACFCLLHPHHHNSLVVVLDRR